MAWGPPQGLRRTRAWPPSEGASGCGEAPAHPRQGLPGSSLQLVPTSLCASPFKKRVGDIPWALSCQAWGQNSDPGLSWACELEVCKEAPT